MRVAELRSLEYMIENYEIPSYNTVLSFFLEQRKGFQIKEVSCQKSGEKVVYLISGGIAAGKSTFAYNLIKNFRLTALPYVSTDIYYEDMFSKGDNFEIEYEEARLYTDSVLEKYLINNVSFIWETVLSKDKKFDYLKRCRENGYHLVCFFIGTQNVDTEVYRARKRTSEGAYNIERDFIKDRYWKSLSALRKIEFMVDTLAVLDNSEKMRLIYYYKSGQKYITDTLPEWFAGDING